MAKIFISYRRDDSQYQADKLHAALKPYVANPKTDIFIDVDNIPLGVDFADHLDSRVAQCEVLLALIGHGWSSARDPKTGQRRLDDPEDFVRIEIASALKRGIPVVPVLLDGAPIPSAAELPEDLRPLARRNGLPVTRTSFDSDIFRLVNGLPIDLPGKRKAKAPPAAWPGRSRSGVVLGGLVLTGLGLGIMLVDPLGWFGGDETEPDLAEPAVEMPVTLAATEAVEVEADPAITDPSTGIDAASPTVPEPAPSRVSTAQRASQRTAGEVFSDCTGCPSMVVIPAGSFIMGSPSTETGRDQDEGPQRKVMIGSNFGVGRYEVTWAEWEACVADGGCDSSGPEGAGGDNGWGKSMRPVIKVDWDDAQAFVSWLSRKSGQRYRLLSEAEWEYAARAGTTTPFSFGATISTRQANYNGNYTYGSGVKGEYREQTTPVGSFPANAFGLYDMHGNVAEWTQDCWNESYSGAPMNGIAWTSGDCSRRVVRGGFWLFSPKVLRSADRYGSDTEDRIGNFGFRVARTL